MCSCPNALTTARNFFSATNRKHTFLVVSVTCYASLYHLPVDFYFIYIYFLFLQRFFLNPHCYSALERLYLCNTIFHLFHSMVIIEDLWTHSPAPCSVNPHPFYICRHEKKERWRPFCKLLLAWRREKKDESKPWRESAVSSRRSEAEVTSRKSLQSHLRRQIPQLSHR